MLSDSDYDDDGFLRCKKEAWAGVSYVQNTAIWEDNFL